MGDVNITSVTGDINIGTGANATAINGDISITNTGADISIGSGGNDGFVTTAAGDGDIDFTMTGGTFTLGGTNSRITSGGTINIDPPANVIIGAAGMSGVGNITIEANDFVTINALTESTGGNVSIRSDFDNAADTTDDLTGNAQIRGATVTLDAGTVGTIIIDTDPNNDLGGITLIRAVNAADALDLGTNVTANGDIDGSALAGNIILTGNSTVQATGNNRTIDFSNVNTDIQGAFDLTIETTGTAGNVDLNTVGAGAAADPTLLDVNTNTADLNDNITTNGDILFDGTTRVVLQANVDMTSTGNAINLNTFVDESGARTLTLVAGAGAITLADVEIDELLFTSGANVTFEALDSAHTGNTDGSDITTTANIDFSGIAAGDNLILNADTIITTGGDVITTAGNIVETGGARELQVAAGDSITLQNVTITGNLDIDLDTDTGGANLDIDTVTAASVDVDGTGVDDTMTFNSTVTSTVAGVAIANATGAADDNISISFFHNVDIGANVTAADNLTISDITNFIDVDSGVTLEAQNGNVDLNNTVALLQPSGGGLVTIQTTGADGDVELPATTSLAGTNLTVNSQGTVLMTGNVNLGAGNLTINFDTNQDAAAETLTFNATNQITANDILLNGGGAANADIVDIDTDLTAGGFLTVSNVEFVRIAAVNVIAQGGNVTIANADVGGNGTLATIQTTAPNDNDVILAAVVNTNGENLTVTSTNAVTLTSIDLTTTGNAGTLIVTIDSDDDSGGQITLLINGQLMAGDITLESGTGVDAGDDDLIDIDADLTATTGNVLIRNVLETDLAADLFGDPVDITGNVDVTFTSVGNIDLSGDGGPNIITATNGNVTLVDVIDSGVGVTEFEVNSGNDTSAQDITLDNGLSLIDINATGELTFFGTNVSTDGGNIDLRDSSDIEINNAGTLTLDTETGDVINAGDILFDPAGDIDSLAGDSLAVNTSTGAGSDAGDIVFGRVGQNNPLGSLTGNTATTVGGIPGTVTFNGNIAVDGGGNVDFSAAPDIDLNADITIDTDGATDADAGDVLFAAAGNIDGLTSARDLLIDTSADGTNRNGGAVTLSQVGQASGNIDNLTVTADASGNGAGGVITLNGDVLTTGDVTLDNDNGDAVSATGITVNQDITAGGNVDIDAEGNFLLTGGDTISAGGTGTIDILSQNASATITGNLVTADGNIDVSANADITQQTGTVIAGTNGDIDFLANTGDISYASLTALLDEVRLTATLGNIEDSGVEVLVAARAALRATTGIGTSDTINTQLIDAGVPGGTVAATITTGGISITNVGNVTEGLIIGTVDGLSGVTAGGGDILVVSSSPMIVADPVSDTGGGNITLVADGNLPTDILTANADITATGGTGNIDLIAGGNILINAGNVSAASSGAVNLAAGEDFVDGGANTAGDGNADITMTDGRRITSGSGIITLEASRNIFLSILSTTGNVIVFADDPDLIVADGTGAISDNLTGDGSGNINITANTADLDAGDGIGAADPIDTAVSTITADTANGNIDIDNFLGTNVTATSLTTGNGDILFSQSGGGNLTVTLATTTNGDIDLDTANGIMRLAVVTAGGNNDVNLTTTVAGSIIVDNVSAANATITANSVNGIFVADAPAFTLVGADDVTADLTAANLDLTAVDGINGFDAGDAVETDATDITAVTTNFDINIANTNAALTTIDLRAGPGADADIIFTQSGGGDLNIDRALNSGVTNFNGTINIQNTAGAITVVNGMSCVTVTGGTGNVLVAATGGNLDVNEVVTTAGGNIDLQTLTDNDINFGAGGNVTSGNGDVDITSFGGVDLSNGTDINAGTGNITITVDFNNNDVETLQIAGGNTLTATDIILSGGFGTTNDIIDTAITAGGTLIIREAVDVQITNVTLTAQNGNLDIITNITLNGGANTTTTLVTTGGDVNIDAVNSATGSPNGESLTINSVGSADLQGNVDLNGGNLTITIDDDDNSTESVDIDQTLTDIDELTILASDTDQDDTITISNAVTTTAFVLIANADTVDVDGNITAGTSLTISDITNFIDVDSGVTLEAQNGNVDLNNTVNLLQPSGGGLVIIQTTGADGDVELPATTSLADTNLTVNSQGTVLMTGNVNLGAGNLTINFDTDQDGPETLTFTATNQITANDILLNGGGAANADIVDIDTDLTAGGFLTVSNVEFVRIDAVNVIAQGGNVTIANADVGGITLDGGNGNLATIQTTAPNDNDVILAAVVNTNGENLTVTSTNAVTLTSIDLTTTGNAGTLIVTIDSDDDSVGQITLLVNGQLMAGDITLESGTGNVPGNDDLIDIDADLTATTGNVLIRNVLETDLATNVDITGNVDVTFSSVGNIDLSGAGGTNIITATNRNATIAPVIDSGGGINNFNVIAGNVATLSAITLNAGGPGTGNVTSTATLTDANGVIDIDGIFTVNGNAEIEANVTADGGIDLDKTLLTGAGITFDTDDGGGADVVISGTLDSEATEANGLTIAAGAANVTFGGVVGTSAASNLRLGNLTVTANVLNLNNVFTNGNIADGNVDFSAVTTTELGGSDRTIDTAGGDVNIGGTIQSTGGNGITINTIADTAATAGGDVTLNDFATPGNVVGFLTVIADGTGVGAGGVITLNGNVTTTGDVTLDNDNGDAVSATGITVNQDITAGGNVDIDAEGNFLLTGGDTISAGGTGTINILSQNGSANITGFLVTADGNIDVSANADITQQTGTVIAGTGGDIDFLADNGDISYASLTALLDEVRLTATLGNIEDSGVEVLAAARAAFRANTGIGTADTINTQLIDAGVPGGTVAATTTTGGISITNVGNVTEGLIIGTVDGLSGVTAAGGDILVVSSSPMIVDDPVSDTGGGNITLVADGNLPTDILTANADITATGGTGNIDLIAGGNILINAGNVSAASSGDVNLAAGEDFVDGSANTAGDGGADITMTDGRRITSGSGQISLEAPRNIFLSILSTTGNVIVSADDNDFGLADGTGAITDNLTGDGSGNINITANTADLDAGDGIGAGGNIDTADTTDGDIDIDNFLATDVTATSLTTTGAGGTIMFSQAGGGNLTVDLATTTNGQIDIDVDSGNLTATLVTTGGAEDINLLTTNTGDILVGNVTTVFGVGGTITANADGAIEESGADGTADLTAKTLDLDAVTGIGQPDTIETAATNITADTTNGNIDLDNTLATDVSANSLTTGNGNIFFTQTGGGNLTAAAGGIGQTSVVDVNASTVLNAASNADGSNIDIDSVAALSLGLVNAGAGDVRLDATGFAISDSTAGNEGTVDIAADQVYMTGTGVGALANVIDTNIRQLEVDATTGGVLVTEVAAGGTLDLDAWTTFDNVSIQTTTGDINITAMNGDMDVTGRVISSAGGNISLSTVTIGDISMFASPGNVTATGAGNISIQVPNGAVAGFDGQIIDAGSGEVDIDADGNIEISSVRTTNNTANAIIIDSANADIVDAGDTDIDIVATGANALVTLRASSGIGRVAGQFGAAADFPLETDITNLDAETTTGGISVDEENGVTLPNVRTTTSGNITITFANTGNGNVEVSGNVSAGGGAVGNDVFITIGNLANSGAILNTAGTGLITADELELLATTGIGVIGGNPINTAVATLAAETETGDIAITNTRPAGLTIGMVGGTTGVVIDRDSSGAASGADDIVSARAP